MHRQVGDLEIRDGLAVRGLLVRHLVMPGGADESMAILDFIAREISPNTYVNVMDQYHPAGRARDFPELGRRVTKRANTSASAAMPRSSASASAIDAAALTIYVDTSLAPP